MKTCAIAILASLFLSGASAQHMTQPKADCEELLNAVTPFAERMLKQHGEFFPFGGAMRPSGEIVSIGGKTEKDRPQSTEVIQLLRDSFKASARAGEYKATAIVYDIHTTLPDTGAKSDAVAVALDHRDNYSVVVVMPYTLQNGNLRFGTTFAQRGEDKVFPRK